MHVGQTALDSVVVIREPLVIESEQMQDGRVEVINRSNIFDGFIAKGVRRAVSEGGLHSHASQPRREAIWVVVSTGTVGL